MFIYYLFIYLFILKARRLGLLPRGEVSLTVR